MAEKVEVLEKVVESKAEMFRKAADLLEGAPRYQELLREEADRVEARNKRNRGKETKVQKENRKIAGLIQKWFETEAEDGVAYSGNEVQLAVGLELSPQKLSALMKKVVGIEKTAKADSSKEHVGYKKKA